MTTSEIEIVYSASTISDRVAELAREVEEQLGDRDPLVVSLLSGSFVFVADFVRAIQKPLRYGFVQTVYGDEPRAHGLIEISFPIDIDVRDEVVLMVKDVVGTGLTEAYLRSQLEDRGATDVKIAALIDMPDERRNEIEVDFRAFEAQRDGMLAGYGMKYEGLYGNLPYIGRLKADGG